MSSDFKNKVLAKFNGVCAYCGNEININNMTVDHVNPKSKGGSLSFNNCFPACSRCNSIKANGTVEEMRNKLKENLSQLKKTREFQMAKKYKLVSLYEEEIVFHFEKME